MKAGLKYAYVRVSKDDQDNQTQIDLIKKQAPDVIVYQDVISGASKKPALGSLIDVLGKGDTLYLYKYDRLSRDQFEALGVVYELQKRGVSVISITEPFDLMTPQGKLMFQMLTAFAEFERNMNSERTKARMAFLKEQGIKLGGKRKRAGNKGLGPLSDAERVFLKEALSGSKDWERLAVDFKEKFGKEYRPNTLRRKAYKV